MGRWHVDSLRKGLPESGCWSHGSVLLFATTVNDILLGGTTW